VRLKGRESIREVEAELVPPDEVVRRTEADDRPVWLRAAGQAPPVVIERPRPPRRRRPPGSQAKPTAAVRPEPARKPPSDQPPGPPPVTPPPETECQITFWRGYHRGAFFASMHVDGEEVAVAESPLFPVEGEGLPERTGKALAAYEALRSQLLEEGWNSVGESETWFAERFRRPEAIARDGGIAG